MTQGNQTPMMRQYHHLKQQYPDKILLFRMGDFYETFGDDAEITAKVLNIALTTRDKKDDPTPLAGFPHHALDQYLPTLVKAGHHVAVAEQVEDPKAAKGIVRREITRIVTPGTLTESDDESTVQANYIASLYRDKQTVGIALCELGTGTLNITETKDDNLLKDEISRYNPAEILIPPKSDFSTLSQFLLSILEDHDYSYETAKDIITDHFNTKNLAALGITPYKSATMAVAALLSYLKETQKVDLEHVSSVNYYDIYGRMILDGATIHNLDLLETHSSSGHTMSLFHVLNKTMTSMGARLLRSWITHPLLEKKEIDQRLNAVEFLFDNPDTLSHLQEMMKQVSDIERIVGRLGLNRANGRDLISLTRSLEHIDHISEAIGEEASFNHLLKQLKPQKKDLTAVASLINKSVTDDPPHTITEGHLIRDGYAKDIDKIRRGASDSKKWINDLEEKEKRRTKIPSLKVRMNKVFGYYIEVTHTHKDKIPEDYIRKQTLVNSERFITPELKEKEEIVFNAEEKLAALEYDCFLEIRENILQHVTSIQKAAHIVAEIDALSGLASSARINDYTRPNLHKMGEKNGVITIKNGRHPIVELSTEEPFISNDLEMNRESDRLIILTGPNMSGKSTYIRQSALIILMAQVGSFVPAESAEMSIVDRIFTRVGASDDLAGGRSTFMVEMDEAANIINNATQHSFIVLDEVGRGTSTYDGVSIAWALAEYIHDVTGARCVFATHYHELLKLEDTLEGVKNFNVAVIEEEDRVIFLRKIEKGGTDRSYGIYVAEMAGLPEAVIHRAGDILTTFEQESMFGVKGEPAPEKKSKEDRVETPVDPSPSHQLSFIDESKNGTIPNLFKELKTLDTDTITPIQALQLLEKWKKRVGK